MLARSIAVALALGLGWMVYMIGMVLTVYDGILSLVFQPFMGALASGLAVALALVLGLVAGVSLFVLAFGYFIGLTYVGTNPETGGKVVTLHPAAGLGGYFFFLLAVANWPISGQPATRGTK